MATSAHQPLSLPGLQETHIWQLYLPTVAERCDVWWWWLTEAERSRAQRFIHATDRNRFILSRGGLRYLLGQYLNCSPKSLIFDYSAYGKPSLAENPKELYFNLTHSGQWVIYAVGKTPWLGIDVEVVTPRSDLKTLIQHCLTAKEQVSLPAFAEEQLIFFLKHWTLKEAHLKAIGLGLSYPMTEIQIAWSPQPYFERSVSINDAVKNWMMALWWPDGETIAAICVEQSCRTLKTCSFPA